MTWNEARDGAMRAADCHLCHPEAHSLCGCKAMCNAHQAEERAREQA